ncbi:hypothetical protein ACEPAI_8321 [Sanghuangporus weigelae]
MSVKTLHARLGHISPVTAAQMVKKGVILGVKLDDSSPWLASCESCIYGRSTRKEISKSRAGKLAKKFRDEIHSDLWGPAPVQSIGGKQYYVTFTDDSRRYSAIFILRSKSQTLNAYKTFANWCLTQHGVKIKRFHSDRGGEFTRIQFVDFLNSQGTEQKLTTHDTPEHNGVAEHLNRTIGERVRSMLHASSLSKNLWAECVKYATWLKNRTSTKTLDGITPHEALTGMKLNLSGLHEWGSRCWVHDNTKFKLDRRAREGRWLGYDTTSNGSRVYWPEIKSVSVKRSVYFSPESTELDRFEGENDQSSSTLSKSQNFELNDTHQGKTPPIQPKDISQHEKRVRKPSAYVRRVMAGGGELPRVMQTNAAAVAADVTNEREDNFNDEYTLAAVMDLEDPVEPRTIQEARGLPEWPLWENTIKEELGALEAAETWEKGLASKGANIIGSKWVFKVKKNSSGKPVCYKARLVAQGFSQVPEVNFFEMYAPVTKLSTVRMILVMAAQFDIEIEQIDIKSAYLNGEFEDGERIYMRPPPGYGTEKTMVYVLKKPIYSLKQSSRKWYQKVTWILVDQLDFKCSDLDLGAFYRRDGDNLIMIVIHVDDFTIAADRHSQISEFKSCLRTFIEISDLGKLNWLLGIKINQNHLHGTISLSQHSYIESILQRFNFDQLKTVNSPMDPNIRLSTAQTPSTLEELGLMRNVPYRECIGSLMYATLATRLNIAFAVTLLSKFSIKPGLTHWEAVRRVFAYLKGTKDLWLTYGGVDYEELKGFTDADGSVQEDRRAILGNAFLINGGAVS